MPPTLTAPMDQDTHGERIVRLETKVETLEGAMKTIIALGVGTLLSTMGTLLLFLMDHMHFFGR